MPIKQEHSAGGVVYQKTSTGLKFLLGLHSGYHKWVLPKGLIETGEKPKQTAVRETKEEMGIKAKVIQKNPIQEDHYYYYADLKDPHNPTKSTRRVAKYAEAGGAKTKVSKTVTFYLLEYVSGDPKDHGWEMADAGWFTYEQALAKMSFDGEKAALKKAYKVVIRRVSS